MKVYTVIALRGGHPMQSGGTYYHVGCYATEVEAMSAAEFEVADRGGKYICEVVEWEVGVGIRERGDDYQPVVKTVEE
jgi:hypothetical protein